MSTRVLCSALKGGALLAWEKMLHIDPVFYDSGIGAISFLAVGGHSGSLDIEA